MLTVKITGSEVEQDAEDLAKRLDDLSPTDDAIRNAVIDQNASVNFDPEHPLSVLDVNAGDGAIGSDSTAYTALLDVDVEELAEIEDRYFDEGST